MPIGGGRDYPRDAAARAALADELARLGGVTRDRADVLIGRYGTRARGYCEGLAGKGETMLAALPEYAREEIVYLAETEMVGSVEDLLRRRTGITLTGHCSPEVVAEVRDLLPGLADDRVQRAAIA